MDKIIVDVKPIANGGNIKASVTASVPTECGAITIHQVKLIQKPGEEAWIAFPRANYDKEGTTHYVNLIEVPWEVRKKIREETLDALAQQS